MSIENSRDLIDYYSNEYGLSITDHLLVGRNIQLAPGTYSWDWDTSEIDIVTFKGTAKGDTLFGSGGEYWDIFYGTAGDDLYGSDGSLGLGYVDYSGAPTGVRVDLTYHGSRTFTDAEGVVQTVDVVGKARDGFGGTDYFAAVSGDLMPDFSIYGFFGSSHRDVMIADPESFWGHEFYGGAGKDLLIGGVIQYGGRGNDRLVNGWENHGDAGNDLLDGGQNQYGGAGNDCLLGRVTENGYNGEGDGYWGEGGDGNDRLEGTEFFDWLIGGTGNDRIFANGGDDAIVTGNEGKDYIDGGAGDDFIDGGVGRDTLRSGSGNDTINPDVEFFQSDAGQPRDGARDLIRVTEADLGDFTDVVLPRAFEEDRDRIDFAAAVKGATAFRVYHENLSYNPDTGAVWRPQDAEPDRADIANTILQIDQNGNGFGTGSPDVADYFLVVIDADLSLRDGHILT